MDLADVKLGNEGDVKVGVEGGKLILIINHVHASGEVNFIVKEDVKYFLEKIKAVVPNWADVLIDVAETALP